MKILNPHLNLSLFFFFVLISNSYSQNIYFVKDVENISYLKIRFCLDSNGRVDSIGVMKDQSDYKNQAVIDEILFKLGKVVLPDTGSVRNNCHIETFIFINQALQYSSLKPEEFKQLETFKTGKFKYIGAIYDSSLIVRTEKEQLETTGNNKSRFEITWIEPNIYILKFVEMGMPGWENTIGETMAVEIIKIIDPKTYVYRSLLFNQPAYGIIQKIE
ncbi:MAG TPA: hypothetical protein DIW47_00480 [Bacteroidetes bacterium]|nr:hypothetical protein [Bacteroidota bacterium]